MQPHDSPYVRHLTELNRLAERLFDVIRREYDSAPTIVLHLDRSDRLLPLRLELPHVVAATLLCAQLLRGATADPATTHPRHVVGLTDFIEQLVGSLLAMKTPNPSVEDALRSIHERVDGISMHLALLVDPGAPGFP